MHFHAWQKGLKTGTYYLRTQAARAAVQMGLDNSLKKVSAPSEEAKGITTFVSKPVQTAQSSPVVPAKQSCKCNLNPVVSEDPLNRKKRCQHKRLCKRLKLVALTIQTARAVQVKLRSAS